jgi:hypothetical protein
LAAVCRIVVVANQHICLVIGTGYSSGSVDSARQNLASTFVNAFVNGGFGKDKLMTTEEDSNSNASWIYKNKDHGSLIKFIGHDYFYLGLICYQ